MDGTIIQLRRATLLCNNCKGHERIAIMPDVELYTDQRLFWDLNGEKLPECSGCMSRDYVVVYVS